MCSVKRTQSKADFDNKECSDNLKTRQDLASLGSWENVFLLFRIICMNFHKTKNLLFTGWSCPGHCSRDHLVLTSCWIMSVPHNLKHSTPHSCWFLATTKYYQSPLRHQCLFKYSSFLLYHTEHTSSFWGFSYLTKQIWYERSHTLTHHIS